MKNQSFSLSARWLLLVAAVLTSFPASNLVYAVDDDDDNRQLDRPQVPVGDANMATLADIVEASTGILVENSFCDRQADISYTGEMDSENWSVELTGTFADQSLSLTYQGTFDLSNHMGFFSGSGAFGQSPWIASGSVAFSENLEIMALDGEVNILTPDPFSREWNANWVISPRSSTVTTVDSVDVIMQQSKPTSAIVAILATWRRPPVIPPRWLHTVDILIIAALPSPTPQSQSSPTFISGMSREESGRCKVIIREEGEQITEAISQVRGTVKLIPLLRPRRQRR